MTPAEGEVARLTAEVELIVNRAELTLNCRDSHEASVLSLTKQHASDELVEEHRDKSAIYHEAYLDMLIHIGKLRRRLAHLKKA